jgi:predicted Zn-dependent protease
VEVNLALAQFYTLTQKPAPVELRVRLALRLNPQSIDALAMLAALQISQQKQEDAERTFKQISELPDRRYRPMHAIFLAQIGRKAEALGEFEKLAGDDPSDIKVRGRLVSLYLELDKTAEAQNVLNAALKKDSKDIDALFQQSLLELKLGKIADAEASLKAILAVSPNASRAHFALANLYRSQNRLADQRLQLNEALRVDSEFLQARVELARSYLSGNDSKSALEILNQAPSQQKAAPAWIIERNWAWLARGNLKELREALVHPIPRRGTRLPDLALQDALVKFRDKDYAGARVAAEEALRARPGDPRAALVLADTYGEQGQPSKGLQRLEEIAAANPKSAALQQILGEWYANAGKTPRSAQGFRKREGRQRELRASRSRPCEARSPGKARRRRTAAPDGPSYSRLEECSGPDDARRVGRNRRQSFGGAAEISGDRRFGSKKRSRSEQPGMRYGRRRRRRGVTDGLSGRGTGSGRSGGAGYPGLDLL